MTPTARQAFRTGDPLEDDGAANQLLCSSADHHLVVTDHALEAVGGVDGLSGHHLGE